MKHSALSSLFVLSLLTGTLTLAGCGGASSFSDPGSASTPPPTTADVVAGPAVAGTVFGGHAPLQGAHVYLLTPGTTGYGSLATSLLGTGTTTSPGGYALSPGSTGDPNVPAAARYVTTDAQGAFNLTGAYVCTVGRPVFIYAYGGKIASTSANNTNVVQLATLGLCPSSGNFSTAGNGALQYVYLNEVSTVAAAYTFQPFTLLTNNDAWHIGSSNTTQGLLGIANAANTAAQLYNIQGATTVSTSNDGEGHLANYETVSNGVSNQGNGVVPQATIDTLANILADCVDSTAPFAPCTTIFTTARADGTTTGTRPVDTATAALNISRFPAGNNSSPNVSANYVTNLFNLQGTGTTPYVPQLTTAPHDWTLPIYYPVTAVTGYPGATNSTLGAAESVAIDNVGQVWVTAQTGDYINRFSNLGARNVLDQFAYIPGYVSIDGANNAWTGNANSTSPIFEAGSNGVFTASYGSGYNKAYTIITNNAGDAFFFASTSATPNNYQMFEYGPGGATIPGSPFNIGGSANTSTAAITISAATVAFSGGGNYTYTFTFAANGPAGSALAVGDTVALTLANDTVNLFGFGAATGWQNLTSVTVATVNGGTFTATGTTPTTNDFFTGNGATGSGVYTYASTTGNPTGNNVAHGAIDHAGDLWITSETGNSISRIGPTGTPIFSTFFTTQQPEFPAIDNSGNAWIPVQETASEIYVVTPAGGQTILTSASTGAELTSSFGSAVDGNGNVWITNRAGNYGAVGTTAGENSIVVINGGSSTPGAAQTAISPPTNYIPEAQYPAAGGTESPILNGPLNLAIDPSGNVWITNYTGGGMVELVGAAAPVATPLSVAAANNQLGAKP